MSVVTQSEQGVNLLRVLSVSLYRHSLDYYLVAEPQNRKRNLTSCGIGHSPSDRYSGFRESFSCCVSCYGFPLHFLFHFIGFFSCIASTLRWPQRMYGYGDVCKTAAQLSTACPKVAWTKRLLFLKKKLSRHGNLWRIWTVQRHPARRT